MRKHLPARIITLTKTLKPILTLWLLTALAGALCAPAAEPSAAPDNSSAFLDSPEPTNSAARKGGMTVEEAERHIDPRIRVISRDLDLAIQHTNWTAAEAKLLEAEKILPTENREALDLLRVKILLGKQDYPAALKLASQTSEAHPDKAILQNELAWMIASAKNIPATNLALADTIATRANNAAKNSDLRTRIGILDTLARVKFLRGQRDEAVVLENQAVQLASGPLKTRLQHVAESYSKGILPKDD